MARSAMAHDGSRPVHRAHLLSCGMADEHKQAICLLGPRTRLDGAPLSCEAGIDQPNRILDSRLHGVWLRLRPDGGGGRAGLEGSSGGHPGGKEGEWARGGESISPSWVELMRARSLSCNLGFGLASPM